MCSAFDDLVATWYGYPFYHVDLASLSTEERRTSADAYVGALADHVARIDAAVAGLGADPVAVAGQTWARTYLATERDLSEAFAAAATNEQYDPAFAAAATAETAADAEFLTSMRALTADTRIAEAPVEACVPSFLRGEPVDGWTSPLAWKQPDTDPFDARTKWPKLDTDEVRTRVVDGEYQVTVKQAGRSHWVSAGGWPGLKRFTDLGDVRVAASVTVPDGTVDGGVMCRESHDFGYLFLVSPSDYQIRRLEVGDSVKLAERFPTTVGHAVPAGKPVVVTGECTGSGAPDDPVTLTLSIDGDVVLHVLDLAPPLGPGAIGVFASTSEASTDQSARFDDLAVSVPKG